MELRDYLRIIWGKRWLFLLAFAATVLATGAFTYFQTPTYQATSTYIIYPTGAFEDATGLVNVLDTMSRRGEIAGTYAKVATSRLIKQQAADDLSLSDSMRDPLMVKGRLLPGTNVLELTVEGSNPQLVKLFADEVGAKTTQYVSELYEAYGLRILDAAVLPSRPVTPNRLLNLALGAILGVILGVGLALLADYLEYSPAPSMAPALPRQRYPTTWKVDRRRRMAWSAESRPPLWLPDSRALQQAQPHREG